MWGHFNLGTLDSLRGPYLKQGHGILHVAPTNLHVKDPCPLDLQDFILSFRACSMFSRCLRVWILRLSITISEEITSPTGVVPTGNVAIPAEKRSRNSGKNHKYVYMNVCVYVYIYILYVCV